MSDLANSISSRQPPYFVGIDLGGTNIKVGVVDDAGRSVSHANVPSNIGQGPEAGAKRMAEAAQGAVAEASLHLSEISYAGLATPGTMDIPRGMLLHPVNLPGWDNFPIRDRVAHHLGLPVAYANDANAAAYGEFWSGGAARYHSMIMLTLGTGVGGGIIIGDLSVDGEHSHGSELGHIIIDGSDDARPIATGQRGHLEAYCSATAVADRTTEALEAGADSILAAMLDQHGEVTSLMVHEAAEAGDALANEIILETARYLGIGITTLAHAIDPAVVLLGGAMDFGGAECDVGVRFLERVRQEVRRRAFPVIAENLVIDFATLGGEAGYIGAAGIGRLAYMNEKQQLANAEIGRRKAEEG